MRYSLLVPFLDSEQHNVDDRTNDAGSATDEVIQQTISEEKAEEETRHWHEMQFVLDSPSVDEEFETQWYRKP